MMLDAALTVRGPTSDAIRLAAPRLSSAHHASAA
jgi:hypothetical protein